MKTAPEVLSCQPDGVEIEERPVPARARWVLYVIILGLLGAGIWAAVFHVDRIVAADGSLITTAPTIVVQPLNAAAVRSLEVEVGDVVKKGQLLATLDSTFASADLSMLAKRRLTLQTQIRRIRAELAGQTFAARKEEGEDGRLQQQLFDQRTVLLARNRELNREKTAALKSKLDLNRVEHEGLTAEAKLLRDVEGTTARLPQTGADYRLRLLEAKRKRTQTANELSRLAAEEEVLRSELRQVRSEWRKFLEERDSELLEQEVQLQSELKKVNEEIHKAERLHELVSLRAPQDGVVLSIAERSVGSIVQQAEPLVTLVPLGTTIEAEVNITAQDIGRIRTGDSARVKLDAFPFQRHGTLPGAVRVISENAFQPQGTTPLPKGGETGGFYKARIRLLSGELNNVPAGFRLLPGMKVRVEIRIGTRSILSYFLYPVIRVFDESLREP